MDRSRVAVVIPAFNEASTIAIVVSAVQKIAKPVVVCDGSTDDTFRIAKKAGAAVLKHKINFGYDKALSSGINFCLQNNFEILVTLDADNQHKVHNIIKAVKIISKKADFAVGIRNNKQRWSEKVFSFAAKNLWNIEDPLCGIKAYRCKALKKLKPLQTFKSIGTEILLKAAAQKFTIIQFRVDTQKRNDKSRFGSGILPNLIILRALILGIYKFYVKHHVFSCKETLGSVLLNPAKELWKN